MFNKGLISFGSGLGVFSTLLLGSLRMGAQAATSSTSATTPQRSIALTIDDLPMTVVGNDHVAGNLKETQRINQGVLDALAQHHAPAIGFLNEVKLNVNGERDARVAMLEQWLAAGLLLGNHGYRHIEFNQATLGEYEDEFVRGDSITTQLLDQHGLKQRYFRHPYLDTGDTAEKQRGFEKFLRAHNYQIAPVTIQIEDWMFNAPYDDAVRRGDKAAAQRVRDAYLAHTTAMFDYAEALTRESFHRDIPQVLLLHADLLNAENLGAVLTLVEKRGYRFISLAEALNDKAYATPAGFSGADGLSWLERWQPALGRPLKSTEPQPPAWVQQQYDALTTSSGKSTNLKRN